MAPSNNKDGADHKTPTPPSAPNKEMVITPAGPVPKDKVREVKPGETVRQNADGTLTIIPKSDGK